MKHALILCSQDAFANGIKSRQIAGYLAKKKYETIIYDTCKLSRFKPTGIYKYLPAPHPHKFYLYLLEVLLAFSALGSTKANRVMTSLLLQRVLQVRGRIISTTFHNKEIYDLVICESNFDQAFVSNFRIGTIQILDLPSPFAEELYFGKLLTPKAYQKLKSFEQSTYAAADYISFHWHSYTDYVRRTKYNGNNFIALTYGSDVKPIVAHYSKNPRIIFMGYLDGYWVNLPLLKKLCSEYPDLDVYGGPKPPENAGINYKGYAPSTDIIAQYQFGLVTISNDELRQNSFSSKHLEYLSYGVPVLTPDWRVDSVLQSGSIYYNEANFLKLIHTNNTPERWRKLHEATLQTASKLTWEQALIELDTIL